jgi:hypothetical protein
VHVATTVDDCFCISNTVKAKEDFKRICREAFKEITVEEGDSLNIIGMHINQNQLVKELTFRLGVTPALVEIFSEDPNSSILKDQLQFMSINSSCMYAGKMTYPEVLAESSRANYDEGYEGGRVPELSAHRAPPLSKASILGDSGVCRCLVC